MFSICMCHRGDPERAANVCVTGTSLRRLSTPAALSRDSRVEKASQAQLLIEALKR